MPQAGFEPTISAGQRPQTYASGTAAAGIGVKFTYNYKMENLHTHKIVFVEGLISHPFSQ
jgi:hypothetical protein